MSFSLTKVLIIFPLLTVSVLSMERGERLQKNDLVHRVYEEGTRYGRVQGFREALKNFKGDISEDELKEYAQKINFSYGPSLEEPNYSAWIQDLDPKVFESLKKPFISDSFSRSLSCVSSATAGLSL